MDRNYDRALAELLESEGGFTNEGTDPGGPTNFGITIYDAHMYLNPALSDEPPWTAADIAFMRNMTVDQAKLIYRGKYWHRMRCEELPDGVDYSVFDFGVNSGVVRSAKYLQMIVGATIDGFIGAKTVAAAKAFPNQSNLIIEFNMNRLGYLHRIKNPKTGALMWPTYGHGWGTRVEKVKRISLEMSAQQIPTS